MDSSSLKPLILKFVSEGPYLQDFTFCIFWYFWHHTIIFCWNFDWDPKSILGPLPVRCEGYMQYAVDQMDSRTRKADGNE